MGSTKTKATKRSAARWPSPAQADKVLREYKKRPALFTSEHMYEFERAVGSDDHGMTRRIALGILTKPCAEIIDAIKSDREVAVAFAAAYADIWPYVSALRELANIIEEAGKRLLIAQATRQDMDEVFAEARVPDSARPEAGVSQ